MTDYCLGFAFKPDHPEWVLLIRKNRPSWQAGKLNGVGGKVEPGEIPYEAMVREFQEEAGLESTHEDWHEFCQLTGGFGHVTCFVADSIPWDLQQFPPGIWGLDDPPEEEYVQSYYVPTLGVNPPGVVSNLMWLIPLALDYLRDPGLQFVKAHY